jgi:hypothetical protein
LSRSGYAVDPSQPLKAFRTFIPSDGPGDDALVAADATLLHPSLVSSRATLCRVLDALSDHGEAVTIIGAHAVHERTKGLAVQSSSTKDGDVAITPRLVAREPNLEFVMRRAGFRPLMEVAAELHGDHRGRRWSDRPGLWGTGITDQGDPVDEVDLMVPERLAGEGRRSVGCLRQHGKITTGRVAGIELAILERDLLPVEDFASASSRHAFVAKASGLICAKAYKITDRLSAPATRSAARLAVLPKDSTDMWRCMSVSNPDELLGDFSRHSSDQESGPAIREGLSRFRQLVASTEIRRWITQHLVVDGVTEVEVDELFEEWKKVILR